MWGIQVNMSSAAGRTPGVSMRTKLLKDATRETIVKGVTLSVVEIDGCNLYWGIQYKSIVFPYDQANKVRRFKR